MKYKNNDSMKRLIVFLMFLTASWAASGQVIDPVSWSAQVKKTGQGQYVLEAVPR